MHPNIVINLIKSLNLILGNNLLFSYFIASLNLLDKSEIVVFHVTFLKNDWGNLMLGCKSFLGFWFFYSI